MDGARNERWCEINSLDRSVLRLVQCNTADVSGSSLPGLADMGGFFNFYRL